MEEVKKEKISRFKTGLFYGAAAGGLYIAFFLLMKLFGLLQYPLLRYVNAVILIGATYLALNKIRENKVLGYLNGMANSMFVCMVSILVFCPFLYLYLNYIDPDFMLFLNKTEFGWQLTPGRAAFWAGHELLGLQALFSIFIMEFLGAEKRSTSPHSFK